MLIISSLSGYFRRGWRRIKRYIAWFPILWKDEDWDYAYFFEIMRFKISRIRKATEKNKIYVGYEENVKQMKVAEELLRRVADSDDFYYELFEQLENKEKQGKCSCPDVTFDFEQCEDSRYSLFVDLSCDFCNKMRRFWTKRQDAKERQDFEFLFSHLKKNVKNWWD